MLKILFVYCAGHSAASDCGQNGTGAWDQLQQYQGKLSQVADFIWGIRAFGFEGMWHTGFLAASNLGKCCPLCSVDELRWASRGKIILAPTNHAMQDAFLRLGLYSPPDLIRSESIAAFRHALFSRLVIQAVSAQRQPMHVLVLLLHDAVCAFILASCLLQSRIPESVRCQPFLLTRNISDPVSGILMPHRRRGKVKGMAAAPAAFSILGQGYNANIGFPLSFGMAAIDPGFT